MYKPKLAKYRAKAKWLLTRILNYRFEIILRTYNGKADALTRLAKKLANKKQYETQIIIRNRRIISPTFLNDDSNDDQDAATPEEVHHMEEIQQRDDWRQSFLDCFRNNILFDKSPPNMRS